MITSSSFFVQFISLYRLGRPPHICWVHISSLNYRVYIHIYIYIQTLYIYGHWSYAQLVREQINLRIFSCLYGPHILIIIYSVLSFIFLASFFSPTTNHQEVMIDRCWEMDMAISGFLDFWCRRGKRQTRKINCISISFPIFKFR